MICSLNPWTAMNSAKISIQARSKCPVTTILKMRMRGFMWWETHTGTMMTMKMSRSCTLEIRAGRGGLCLAKARTHFRRITSGRCFSIINKSQARTSKTYSPNLKANLKYLKSIIVRTANRRTLIRRSFARSMGNMSDWQMRSSQSTRSIVNQCKPLK